MFSLILIIPSSLFSPSPPPSSPPPSSPQELFGGYDGVPVLVSCLKRDPSLLPDEDSYHRLFLSTIDCIWCSVVGHNSVEDIFLEEGGVFALLDLIHVSIVYM